MDNELEAARRRIAELELSNALLKAQAEQSGRWAEQCHERYIEAARQHGEVMSLYVAAQRLHESLERKDVLAAIQEIVINLIGSEELAVFEIADGGQSLRLVDSFGIEPARWETVPMEPGPLAESIRAGRAYVAPAESHDGKLTACVPLMAGERAIGLVAVFSLLPQKPKLERVDHDLFDVLRAHGGNALFSARLAEKTR